MKFKSKLTEIQINNLFEEVKNTKGKKEGCFLRLSERWLDIYNKLIKDGKMEVNDFSDNYRKMLLIRDMLWDYSKQWR